MKTTILCIFCLAVAILSLFSCSENLVKENSTRLSEPNVFSNPTSPTPEKDLDDAIAVIVEKAINLEKFQDYYHISTNPERKPLYILQSKFFPKKLNISKFGETVEFATCDELKKLKKPYIEFIELNINSESANAVFRYYVEGVEVKINFIKRKNDWEIEESNLVEKSFKSNECGK